jgi:hypothetical protein
VNYFENAIFLPNRLFYKAYPNNSGIRRWNALIALDEALRTSV